MLKDWELAYDRSLNKWRWVDVRIFSEPTTDRERVGREKNGFYPYEFNFLQFVKTNITQCSYCGIFRQSRKLTRDHVYPKSLGGDKTTPACRTCNQAKTNMKPIEFAVWFSKEGRDIAMIPAGYDPLEE